MLHVLRNSLYDHEFFPKPMEPSLCTFIHKPSFIIRQLLNDVSSIDLPFPRDVVSESLSNVFVIKDKLRSNRVKETELVETAARTRIDTYSPRRLI